MLPPLLGDLQRAYRVSLLEVLAVANAMYLVYGLSAIPAGFLADRFGSRRMLIAAATGCAASLFVTATATTFPVLAVGLVSLGVSAGVYHPSGLSLLSRGVTPAERGRAIGIHGAGGNLGEALAPAWAAFFAAVFDWRIGFVAAGALSLACAALAASLPREVVSEVTAPPLPLAQSARRTFSALAVTLVGFWRNRRLRWLLGALIAAGFIYRGFLTFLSLHLASGGGGGVFAGPGGSYVMSAVLVVGVVAQRFGGELADRCRFGTRERLLLVEVAFLAPLLLGLAFAQGPLAVALALSFGFVWAITQPVANALTASYCRPSCHGLLYGIQFAATFAVGSFATTFGGFLLGLGGTKVVFVGLAGVAVAALAAVGVVAAIAARRRQSATRNPSTNLGGSPSAPAEPA
jgi:MFS family permease